MRTLKRLAALPWKDRLLLIRAVLLVAIIRVALSILPFRMVLHGALRTRRNSHAADSVDKVGWAVNVVSRYVPRATCLTQALAVQVLLARSGHESTLKLGVANDLPSGFEAHAWVVCGDKSVIGGEEATVFRPLASWSNRSDGINSL